MTSPMHLLASAPRRFALVAGVFTVLASGLLPTPAGALSVAEAVMCLAACRLAMWLSGTHVIPVVVAAGAVVDQAFVAASVLPTSHSPVLFVAGVALSVAAVAWPAPRPGRPVLFAATPDAWPVA